MNAAVESSAASELAAGAVRSLFPCFTTPAWAGLHYLDNAATTQKPRQVIDAVERSMREFSAPIHRGLYPLAEQASTDYERVRKTMARFIGATRPDEIVLTTSVTSAINLVAEGWLSPRLRDGDEICVTRMEHHANLLPWQRLARKHNVRLRVIELTQDGRLNLDSAQASLNQRTRLLAVTRASNVLGTLNPIAKIAAMAHQVGAQVLVDATQSVAHCDTDVQALGCDFLAFSAHKMYGPAGAGVLWGHKMLLNEMEPMLLGGGMVSDADPMLPQWRDPPERFEAGSPNLPAVVGMAAASQFVGSLQRRERLSSYLLDALKSVRGLRLHGPGTLRDRLGIFSFQLSHIHPHDVAAYCGDRGICIRAGHHCCQPLHQWLGVPGSVRASLAAYNTPEDVDALVVGLHAASRQLK